MKTGYKSHCCRLIQEILYRYYSKRMNKTKIDMVEINVYSRAASGASSFRPISRRESSSARMAEPPF